MYYSKHYIKIDPSDLRQMADDIENHAMRDGLSRFAWITFRESDSQLEMMVEQPSSDRKNASAHFCDPSGSFTTYYGVKELR